MLDRFLLAAAIIVLGLTSYRLLLFAQAHRVAGAARSEGSLRRPVLLVFTSPTCAPCKLQQIPVAERLVTEWGERVELRVVDVTQQPEVADRFGVWSVPTTIVLGPAHQVVAVNQGVTSEGKLRAQFAPWTR